MARHWKVARGGGIGAEGSSGRMRGGPIVQRDGTEGSQELKIYVVKLCPPTGGVYAPLRPARSTMYNRYTLLCYECRGKIKLWNGQTSEYWLKFWELQIKGFKHFQMEKI